jgi:hypothetical protein
MAVRIRARAIRRCGELLKQFDGRGRASENTVPAHGISQREAADRAGMSEHQQLQASRVANSIRHLEKLIAGFSGSDFDVMRHGRRVFV